MLTKIRDKNYKVIVNSGSCINVISFKVIENIVLEAVLHPHPNKVSWINSTVIRVQQLSHLYFWRTMWHMLGTKSKFFTAFNFKSIVKLKSSMSLYGTQIRF